MSEVIATESDIFGDLERLRSNGGFILEVGAGFCPSPTYKDAQLFSGVGDVRYVALDLPVELFDKYKKYETPAIAANANAIPIADGSFDLALMKSVFGQFTGSRRLTSIEDIRTWGMMELARVLKPGGQLLVFEENTPWYPKYIESYGTDVGFEVVETIYKFSSMDQREPFERWGQIREFFYDPESDRHSGRGYADKDFVKCVVLRKPQDAVMEEETHKILINSHAPNSFEDGVWVDHIDDDGQKYSTIHYPNAIYKELVFKTIKSEEIESEDNT